MIHFRCWFCNRAFMTAPERAGERFRCKCGHRAKVPRRSYGSSKIVAGGDRLVEALVYGGLCATMSVGLSFAAISRAALLRENFNPLLVAGVGGFAAGALFGERALNYFGQKFRSRESG